MVRNKESGPKRPELRVSGVPPEADQVSGKNNKKLKPETSSTGKAIERCPPQGRIVDCIKTRFSILNKVLCLLESGVWLLLTIGRIIW